MERDLMQRLAKRTGLAKKFGVRYVDEEWPYLIVQHPVGAVRVVGEAKGERTGNGLVFLRGQVKHYSEMRPSLFRGVSDSDIPTLRSAERALTHAICHIIPQERFKRPNLPALLQHYGFKTSWLDVVDNLFIAAWFAGRMLRTGEDGSLRADRSTAAYGWLYLITTEHSGLHLRIVDLRRDHHPLSARPHVQHGVSLAAPDEFVVDLRQFIIATLRIPLRPYSTSGALFDPSVIIPPSTVDDTLRILLKADVNRIAATIEERSGLSEGALGRVFEGSAV
jgi:hypothetical protein